MIALLVALVFAGPLDHAAASYDRGDYPAAISTYQEISAPSGVVLYNLGASYYRQGDAARAIAYYRAATRTRPRDTKLAHSLAIVRGALSDVPSPVDPPRIWQAFVTSGELGIVGLFGLAASSLLAAVARRRGRALWPSMLVGVAGLVFVLTALLGVSAANRHRVAVVVDTEAIVRDAARGDADERFRLQPGAEVLTQRTLGGFHLVTTGDGRRGWVPTGAVLAVGIPAPSTEEP